MQKYLLKGALALLLLCARQVQSAASSSGNSLTVRLRGIGELDLREDINKSDDLKRLAEQTKVIYQSDFSGFYWNGEVIYNAARDLVLEDAPQRRPTLPPSQSMTTLPQPKPELPRMGSLPSLPVSSGVPAELRRIGGELMVTEDTVKDVYSGAFKNGTIFAQGRDLKKFAEGYGQQRGDLDRSLWALGQFQSITNYEAQFRGVVRPRTPYSRPIKLRDALRRRDELPSMPEQSSPARDDSSSIPSSLPTPELMPRPTQTSIQPTLPPFHAQPSPTPSPIRPPEPTDIPVPRIPAPTGTTFAPVQERGDIVEYRRNPSKLQDICDDEVCGPNVRTVAQAVQERVLAARGMNNLTEAIVAETAYELCSSIDTSKRVWQVAKAALTFDDLVNRSVLKVERAIELLQSSQRSFQNIMSSLFEPPAGGLPNNKLADLIESEVGFGVVNTARLTNVREFLRNRA